MQTSRKLLRVDVSDWIGGKLSIDRNSRRSIGTNLCESSYIVSTMICNRCSGSSPKVGFDNAGGSLWEKSCAMGMLKEVLCGRSTTTARSTDQSLNTLRGSMRCSEGGRPTETATQKPHTRHRACSKTESESAPIRCGARLQSDNSGPERTTSYELALDVRSDESWTHPQKDEVTVGQS